MPPKRNNNRRRRKSPQNSSTSTALVQISQLRQRVNNLQNSGRISNRLRPRSNLDIKRYHLSLVDPFHPDVRGVKSCVYAYDNTVPLTVYWKGVLSTRGNAITDAIFQPNPCFYGWVAGQSTAPQSRMFQTVMGPVTQNTFGSSVGMNGVLVDRMNSGSSIVGNTLANYRVVSGGIRVRSIAPISVANPSVTAVPVLVQNSDLSYGNITGGGYSDGTYNRTTPSDFWTRGKGGQNFIESLVFGDIISDKSSTLTIPGVREFTAYQATNTAYTFKFLPVTPEAFEFKDLGYNERPSMTNDALDEVSPGDIFNYDQTSGGFYTKANGKPNARRGATDVAGFQGWLLSSFHAGDQPTFESFQVEYILHIEGTPVGSGLTSQRVSGTMSTDDALRVARAVPSSIIERVMAEITPQRIANTLDAITATSGYFTRGNLRSDRLRLEF